MPVTLHRLVRAGLTLGATAVGLFCGLVVTLASRAPSERDLETILTSPQIEIDSQYLAPGRKSDFVQHAVCRCGLPLDPEKIPRALQQALLAQEDMRFYIHRGIDWIGLGRALLSDLLGGSLQGGSTLTQQLAKNLITGNARSGASGMVRKIREAIIARSAERALTKERILAAYLNQMDFGTTGGSTAIGVVQAASKYFGKSVGDLDLYEAAMLVGMLRATITYNPIVNPDAADRRAKAVLQRMLDHNVISRNEFSNAMRQTIRRGSLAPIVVPAGYYIAWSQAELAQIAHSRSTHGPVRFVVGLDAWHQVNGELAIRESISENADRHVSQGALVSMESDGRVGALVGGTDFASSQFDRATQATRQPGSAFKPFVYMAALQMGLEPGSVRMDAPISVGGWTPENADHKFLGPVTLTQAIAYSRNTVAVRLGIEVGIDTVVNEAHLLGIKSSLRRDASVVLGTSEVTLLELTAAYVPFMNHGRVVQPYAAVIALDSSGQVIYRRDPVPNAPVVNGRTVRAMRQLLRAVVTEGTGRHAQLREVWSAGKTGTSQGNRDAWFIGFTDQVATGIWFGNDDNSEMTGIAGGNMPASTWRWFNEHAMAPPAAIHPGSSALRVAEMVARPSPGQSLGGQELRRQGRP